MAGHLRAAGWTVCASDGSSRMVEGGRERLGDAVTWRQADLAAQPWLDATFDLVTSSFGLIFASDPSAALAEVVRVLKPGGRLLLTAWTADGYMATMTDVVASFFTQPPPPGPFRWGDEAFVRHTLASGFDDVRVRPMTLPWTFASTREARLLFEEASPGHRAAIAALDEDAGAMMDAVEADLARWAAADGTVDLTADYLLVVARLQQLPGG